MAPAYLSKSRYLNGMQCLKYLWLVVNDPDSVPQPDAKTKQLFDQGHVVQQLAEKLFPDGVRLPESVLKAGDVASRLAARGRTFFEAAISANGLYSRLDILKRNEAGKWDIMEIKSSTRVKDENLHDVSFQKVCCEKRGLAVDRCFLIHINNKYVKRGEIDPAGLLSIEDITEAAASVAKGIEERIEVMLGAIQSKTPPDSRVGPHCKEPYECPVKACWEALPDNTVLDLYRGGAKGFELLFSGTRYLRDIPDSVRLSEPQKIQKWCEVNSCPHVDAYAIKSFLKGLRYPVHYLDFETFNTAVPIFDGTRPYQQVPFQFSLHTVDKPGAMAWHFGHLAEGSEDPRPMFIEQLRKLLGPKGSVVVYNQTFEETVLRDLAETFPEHREWVDQVCERMVDLLEPFRSFSYYHPAQKGSASIKSVLPALTGKDYGGLDIGKGDEASLAYLNMTFGNMTDEDKAKTRADLEKYCGLDTEGMIWIVDKLREACA